MRYISTRSHSNCISFSDVTLQGLAKDGGLYVPKEIPELASRLGDSVQYRAICDLVFSHFMSPEFSSSEVSALVESSYANFDVDDVVALVDYPGARVLELFHGPTLAFKDIALQFLGRVFSSLLSRQHKALTVLGATSGDTGGAAIAGLAGIEHCQVYMLFPKGRISQVQELQMVAGVADNIYPLEVDGSFDDAQRIVKQLFSDAAFNQSHGLTAVNSINWCRIMAQMVYYFYAFQQDSSKQGSGVSFSVPTGNFGDVLAGYYAYRSGLPVNKLIVACNRNDLLARVYREGVFRPSESQLTLSPAMDIQLASNFERLLFELADRDSDYIVSKMEALASHGEFTIEAEIMDKLRELFEVYSISDEQTSSKMKQMADQGVMVDPHTAVGLCAADLSTQQNVICLSTAHPVKFAETIKQYTGQSVPYPSAIEALKSAPQKRFSLPCSTSAVRNFISSRK